MAYRIRGIDESERVLSMLDDMSDSGSEFSWGKNEICVLPICFFELEFVLLTCSTNNPGCFKQTNKSKNCKFFTNLGSFVLLCLFVHSYSFFHPYSRRHDYCQAG